MNAQPRQPNPRGSGERLRAELVAAARELLLAPRQDSPFSLRAVAKSTGVSPAAVYRHFASAEDLISAVIDDHNVLLREAIGVPAGAVSADALAQFGASYVRWGLANPGAYQLLFESADRYGHPIGPGTPGWTLLEDVADWLRPELGADATHVTIRAWTWLHGLTSLRLHKPTLDWPTTIEAEALAIAHATLGR